MHAVACFTGYDLGQERDDLTVFFSNSMADIFCKNSRISRFFYRSEFEFDLRLRSADFMVMIFHSDSKLLKCKNDLITDFEEMIVGFRTMITTVWCQTINFFA